MLAALDQELFDAIVVNPYDDDAVADAIAALRQRLAHPDLHPRTETGFPLTPSQMKNAQEDLQPPQ